MKKIILFITILMVTFSLASCSYGESPDKIEKEPTITQIENTITDVVGNVEKACIGIRSTTASGQGTGSGVIYKESNGEFYAVTNEHVIAGATKIQVYLGKVMYYTATLIGKDAKNDLAVIKFKTDIYGGSAKAIDINSTTDIIKAGQTVIAIGCPLGLENYNAVSTGVVSRVNSSDGKIQHSAEINPGNSGGALFNASGRLIGINVEKMTQTQTETGTIAVEGVGYAIGMKTVKTVIMDIEAANTEVERPLLGITVSLVNRYIATSDQVVLLPTSIDQAPVVSEVAPNKPGYKAGVKVNDVVIKIGTKDVVSNEDIVSVLSLSKYNEQLSIVVLRKNTSGIFERIELNINLVK